MLENSVCSSGGLRLRKQVEKEQDNVAKELDTECGEPEHIIDPTLREVREKHVYGRLTQLSLHTLAVHMQTSRIISMYTHTYFILCSEYQCSELECTIDDQHQPKE